LDISHRFTRTLAIGTGTSALLLGLVAAPPAGLAQTGPALNGAPVDLHAGTCLTPTVEPTAEVGDLERYAFGEVADDLDEDLGVIGEDIDADAIMDTEEELETTGVLDASPEPLVGDEDGDGVPNEEEEGFLAEDLDVDGALDPGEDTNRNGTLDAGIDEDGDGVLDEEERFDAGTTLDANVGANAPAGAPRPTVWRADGEIDRTFDELLTAPHVIAVHRSAERYGELVACADVAATQWEERDRLVLGLEPVGDTPVYGYAVLERDTGNIPVFGEDTTGVTVYLFEDLSTMRDERLAATPAATPAP